MMEFYEVLEQVLELLQQHGRAARLCLRMAQRGLSSYGTRR